MNTPKSDDTAALTAAWDGDEAAFAELFDRYRKRLRRMVKLRLDRRLYGRVDEDDVLQEAFLEAYAKLPQYRENSDIPLFLWLRLVVGEKLMKHLKDNQIINAGLPLKNCMMPLLLKKYKTMESQVYCLLERGYLKML